ncbi:MAG: hypothetical protein ABIV47_14040 [Roseiflexaceae bacterium]
MRLYRWRLWLTATLLFALSACAPATLAPAADPPGALVRLQRAENATSLPGDFTVFGNGSLQLYLGDRGALRKAIPLGDLVPLQAALNDAGVAALAEAYPAALPAGAGDTLTIYGTQRRTVRFDSRALDLPPVLQQLVSEVMRLRGRF